jgi:predicted SnoaL-like aldol condensation-catalyzing enzyme
MRRVAFPLTIALALVTGLILWDAAPTLTWRVTTDSGLEDRKLVVRRFYDAANQAIATGDLTLLNAMVATDFVEHEPLPGLPPGRAGLVRYLTTLHATYPRLRLAVASLLAEGDQVVARVAVEGAPEGALLGIALTEPLPVWSAVDRFRVAGDMIVERWGAMQGLSLLEPLQQIPVSLLPPSRRAVAVERFSFLPGGSRTWQAVLGPRLLYLEAGALTVVVDRHSPWSASVTQLGSVSALADATPIAPGGVVTLAPGEMILLAEDARVSTRNDGSRGAVLVAVEIYVPGVPGGGGPGAGSVDAEMIDLSFDVLTSDLAISLRQGEAVFAIGRATLAPGARFAGHETAGSALLIVESGSLSLTTPGTTATVRRGADGTSEDVAKAMLTVGDVALLPPRTAGSWRNEGDGVLVVLVVAVRPTDPPEEALP